MLSFAQAMARLFESWTIPPCWQRRARPVEAEDGCHRADVDDLPAPLPDHVRVDLAAAQKRPAQVHVLHEVPVRRLVVLGPAADGRPGVVDKDVETPISVYCLGHGGLDRLLVGHVYRGARGIRAECTKLLHGGGGLVLVPRGHGDAGVRRGKPLGDPRPMPPFPPVTIATLPLRSKSSPVMSRPRSRFTCLVQWNGTPSSGRPLHARTTPCGMLLPRQTTRRVGLPDPGLKDFPVS